MIANSSGYNLKKRKKRMKRRQMFQKFSALLLIIIALIALSYILAALHFHHRFLPRTTINGVHVAGKTADKAMTALEESIENYALEVKFLNDQTQTIQGQSIDYTCAVGDGIAALLDGQHKFAWFFALMNGPEYTIDMNPQYSESLLQTELARMPQLQEDQMIPPEDAGIIFENGSFEIVPETEGTTINRPLTEALIRNAILAGETELDLTEKKVYSSPSVRSDDAELVQTLKDLNQYSKASVTYELYNKKTVTVDIDTMKTWLKRDENDRYSFDRDRWESEIYEYVKDLAMSYDTVYKTHQFRTTAGAEVVLPADGYYGWKIDVTEESKKLSEDISQGNTVSREPVYKRREASSPDDNNGFGNTYCEINLTGQHMWIYKNGALELETDIVSGTNTDKLRTPAGAFAAYDKQSPKILQGDRQEDGSFGYRSEVNYWIRLTEDGVGIHDASWRDSFGGSIWKENGSHGCINVPPELAQRIYNLIDEDMPICVYYLN